MKAKAKLLVDLSKYWGDEEYNSVRITIANFHAPKLPGVIYTVRVRRTIVMVDGKDEIDTTEIVTTWDNTQLVRHAVLDFDRLVANHPASHLADKSRPDLEPHPAECMCSQCIPF